MKLLFRGLLLLAVLLVIFLIVGMMLPESLQLQRSIVINKKADSVYPYVSNFHMRNQWSPWAKIDGNTIYTFEGAEQGVGAIMHWSSEHPQVGKGSQKIIQASDARSVKSVLVFSGMGKAHSYFNLDEQQDMTTVTWGFEMHFGYNIPGRIFGLWMKDEINKTYDLGLQSLKQLLETSS